MDHIVNLRRLENKFYNYKKEYDIVVDDWQ
jgi:hypothetical protein